MFFWHGKEAGSTSKKVQSAISMESQKSRVFSGRQWQVELGALPMASEGPRISFFKTQVVKVEVWDLQAMWLVRSRLFETRYHL